MVGFTGGSQTNSGFVFISLKPLAERKVSADAVVGRLRGKLAAGAGRAPVPAGGRGSAHRRPAEQRDLPVHPAVRRRARLYQWAPRLIAAMQKIAVMNDVNSDQQQGGLETD